MISFRVRSGFIAGAALLAPACAPEPSPPAAPPPSPAVRASAETDPVASAEDAADDPAIWIHPEDPARSLVLGTDKQLGLNVYRLDGVRAQFLPSGRLNNVDVRQAVTLGAYAGDVAGAGDRSDNTVVLFAIAPDGAVAEAGRFASAIAEPYGFCLGLPGGRLTAFVTHKTGEIIAYEPDAFSSARVTARLKLSGQLEGCVFDDNAGVLYVGEEAVGVWRFEYAGAATPAPALIDRVGSETRLAADVEGLAIYAIDETRGYLLASSQGNSIFTVYDRERPNAYRGRFVVADGGGLRGDIDGVAETDGVEATSAPLGPDYPKGVFIAQDGFNADPDTGGPSPQNFKIIDWRAIEEALGLQPAEASNRP